MSQTPSVFLTPGFTPNPYYGKVASLITEKNAQLVQDINSFVDGLDLGIFGNDIPAELIDEILEMYGDQIDEAIDIFEETEFEQPQMPPGPTSAVLYNRVEEATEVVDLGSGDGRKAEKAKIKNVVLTDKVVPEGNFSRRWEQLDMEDGDRYEAVVGDNVVTSFMALSQVENIGNVKETDGIHIVPDTDYLRSCGVAELAGNKIRTVFRGKTFEDFEHDYGSGYEVVAGYKGVCTFKTRKKYIELERKCYKTKPPDLPKVHDSRFNVDRKATPKVDGVQVVFDLRKDGTGMAMNRKGLARKVTHNFGFDVQMITEHVKGVYVLLRILKYHGFIPWHDITVMDLFCRKVDIDIAGARLITPSYALEMKLPVDGLIMRSNEVDYRVKDETTIDIDNEEWIHYLAFFRKNSVPYKIDQEPTTQLAEYVVEEVNGVYHFKFARPRKDKEEATCVDTFLFMVGF